MVSASFGHFKSPLGWRFDLIIRDRRLECGVYDALTFNQTSKKQALKHWQWSRKTLRLVLLSKK
ncbi:hypothetical protein FLL80_14270 [Vibrio cholerae]|nr:hypothetical protein FLL80_14270 [Vibrio cholerae]TQQ35458.1 hypothetical protein FLL64_19645 [Vibrio cholerae]